MGHNLRLKLAPVDTLMFRDGRPFIQSDSGASEAVSIFPPYQPTVVGAVRAALWQELVGRGSDWDKSRLGDGTDWRNNESLGPLRFGAVTLMQDDEALYPLPAHILSSGDAKLVRLLPGRPVDCDLGARIRLPEPVGQCENLDEIENAWVSQATLTNILIGKLPLLHEIIDGKTLWANERRVGVGLDPESRTTVKGELYMATHIRPSVGVAISIELESSWASFPETLRPLGGEHRMAEISEVSTLESSVCSSEKFSDDYFIYIASPLLLDNHPLPGTKISGLAGTVVSACLKKPIRIGGWDSQARSPIALTSAIPAGSVIFMTGGTENNEQYHGKHIGRSTSWGFGKVYLGNWIGEA